MPKGVYQRKKRKYTKPVPVMVNEPHNDLSADVVYVLEDREQVECLQRLGVKLATYQIVKAFVKQEVA